MELSKVASELANSARPRDRENFIRSRHDNGMDTPKGGWGLYDIHHIKPLEFGGVTSFENMTPIIRGTHQTEFNTFWRNYGK